MDNKDSYYERHRKDRIDYQLSYENSHREQVRKYKKPYMKKYMQNRRLECINHYSHGTMKCACCGESIFEFLTIDHINNDGAEHRRQMGSGNINNWLVTNGFPEGFQVLCMNCNWGKRKTGECPHKSLNTTSEES